MLTKLHVCDFRCHTDKVIDFSSPRTVFIGENGNGKTSLLEAIYFLAQCRSFRTHQNKEIVQWGKKHFGVSGEFQNRSFHRLKVEWSPAKRELSIDHQDHLTFREYWGKIFCVIYQNRDRQLISGTSKIRRQWADSLISIIEPDYLGRIQTAQQLLKQKKALLHSPQPDRQIWEILTEQLKQECEIIHRHRHTFTETWKKTLQALYEEQAGRKEKKGEEGKKENLTFHYQEDIPKQLEKPSDKLWQQEREYGYPLLGAHREDWLLKLENKSLKEFGSEGQQKTAALTLRHLELKITEEKTGHSPLVLVDDALGELDPERQQRFWEKIPDNAQILLATTRSQRIPQNRDFTEIGI